MSGDCKFVGKVDWLGRWIASADTPDGPSLGLAEEAIDAVERALGPFDGIVDELLASLPRGVFG